ncbi:MAG TPA: GTP cyclohydrolase II [Methylophilaceae bacterium]|nr:GTP cyclohydrolase II [Methylophilaceae bacterium]
MSNIVYLSSSKLPTAFGDYVIHVYQDLRTHSEHVALVMGSVTEKNNVLTRVHSECLTGDIFSSQRCDCGEQLKLAQQIISKERTGVIIYLRDHEGRGIGLGNKIRAYELQDNGLDTVDANLALGLPVDSRSFEIASDIIQHLKINSINLLSNNPHKKSALIKLGVSVKQLTSLAIESNIINRQYLQTKLHKLGHLLSN